MRITKGEYDIWMRLPRSLRKALSDQQPLSRRKRVLAEYDRLYAQYMTSDAHCRMGTELAMKVAYRMAGGKS